MYDIPNPWRTMGSQSNGVLLLRQGLYVLADSLNILHTYTVVSTRDYYIHVSYTNGKISTRGWGGRAWSLAIHVCAVRLTSDNSDPFWNT